LLWNNVYASQRVNGVYIHSSRKANVILMLFTKKVSKSVYPRTAIICTDILPILLLKFYSVFLEQNKDNIETCSYPPL